MGLATAAGSKEAAKEMKHEGLRHAEAALAAAELARKRAEERNVDLAHRLQSAETAARAAAAFTKRPAAAEPQSRHDRSAYKRNQQEVRSGK